MQTKKRSLEEATPTTYTTLPTHLHHHPHTYITTYTTSVECPGGHFEGGTQTYVLTRDYEKN